MKINHEETKNTKISSILPSCSSFLRGYFRRRRGIEISSISELNLLLGASLLLAFDRLQIKVGILFHHFGAAWAANIKDAPVDFVLDIFIDGRAHHGAGLDAVALAQEFLLAVF